MERVHSVYVRHAVRDLGHETHSHTLIQLLELPIGRFPGVDETSK